MAGSGGGRIGSVLVNMEADRDTNWQVDAAIAEKVAQDKGFSHGLASPISIPGIAKTTAFRCSSRCQSWERSRDSRRPILLDTDLFRDSRVNGKAKNASKADEHFCGVIYMPALVASR